MVNNNNNGMNHNICICKEEYKITMINISADKFKIHWEKTALQLEKNNIF